jgi:hypothetical protein
MISLYFGLDLKAFSLATKTTVESLMVQPLPSG